MPQSSRGPILKVKSGHQAGFGKPTTAKLALRDQPRTCPDIPRRMADNRHAPADLAFVPFPVRIKPIFKSELPVIGGEVRIEFHRTETNNNFRGLRRGSKSEEGGEREDLQMFHVSPSGKRWSEKVDARRVWW